MAEPDELAALMPRSLGGRRLSNVAFDSAGLRAYQQAMNKLRGVAVRALPLPRCRGRMRAG